MNRYISLLLLIIPTQLISIFISKLLWKVYSIELYIAPAEPRVSAGYGFLFSLIPIASSFILVRLFRLKGVRAIVALLQSLVVAMSFYIILYPFLGGLSIPISIGGLIISVILLAKGGRKSKTGFVCLFSALAAILLALSFPLIMIMVFSIILALFDLYAVFKGPLSKGIPMALAAETAHIVVGVGDLIFYALIPSSLYIYKGIAIGMTSLLLINVGALISARLLRERETVPGLPIPLLLTLPFFLI